MPNSKTSRIVSLYLMLFFISCASLNPSYKVLTANNEGVELLLDSKRVYATCANASGDDKVHILLLHVLNDKNLVDDFVYGMAYPKEDCFAFKSGIERVIKNGKRIYIGATGDGKVNLKYTDENYIFSDLGQFPFSKIVFGFRVIKNEKGQCYSFAAGSEKDASCFKAGVDFLVGSPVSGY